MRLAEVKAFFSQHGMSFQWRGEDAHGGADAILASANDVSLGNYEVAIVIPDCHLGWGNDVFRYNHPSNAGRLERFLDTLISLRAHVGADAFDAVQLGDWYDLWRAGMPTTQTALQAIEAGYQGVFDRVRTLGMRHCVGNHDAAVLQSPPPADAHRIRIVETIGASDFPILCFHGHNLFTLQRMFGGGTGEWIGLNLVNLIASLPLLGPLAAHVQSYFDDSLADPWQNDTHDLPWPGSPAVITDWTAPWVIRDDTAELANVVRGFELVSNVAVQAALIGHSHRPGIAFGPVSATRDVPIIDVGSWTYGRAEFAVVAEDGIGLAKLQ